jgi:general secretion pathway protein K
MRRRSESGVALVTVLWAFAILSVIAASVIATGRSEARLTRTLAERARLQAVADAGIARAILALLAPAAASRPALDGSGYETEFAGERLSMSVQDEAGKIDLNTASDELLVGLLASAGLDPDAARAQADKIEDWREPGDLKRLNGAKASDYQAAGYLYGPRGGPFETVEELGLVLGMTPALVAKLRPAVTVYSQLTGIDASVAPPEALRALPGMTADKLQSLLASRGQVEQPADLSGHVLMIRCRIVSRTGATIRREAVLRLTGIPRRPFRIYRWS